MIHIRISPAFPWYTIFSVHWSLMKNACLVEKESPEFTIDKHLCSVDSSIVFASARYRSALNIFVVSSCQLNHRWLYIYELKKKLSGEGYLSWRLGGRVVGFSAVSYVKPSNCEQPISEESSVLQRNIIIVTISSHAR